MAERKSLGIGRGWIIAIAAIVALAALVLLLKLASAPSAPGDSLYPVKKTYESAGEYLLINREAEAYYALGLADARVDEANALLRKKRTDEAEKLVEEAEKQNQRALAAAEFLLEQSDINRIIEAAEENREDIVSIRRKLSPANQ